MALVIAGAMTPALVSAQESTPAVPAVPCDVEPMNLDDLIKVYFDDAGTPIAVGEFPTPISSIDQVPAGSEVDDETLTEISDVAQEWASCFTAGDFLRAFALMTPDAIRQFGPDFSDPSLDTPEEVKAFLETRLAATPEPGMDEGENFMIEGPLAAFKYDDGSIGSVWTAENDAVYLVMVEQDGKWLVDQLIDITDADE
jgi:hypothetical protein